MCVSVNAIPGLGMAFPYFWPDLHVRVKSSRNYMGTGSGGELALISALLEFNRLAKRSKHPREDQQKDRGRIKQAHSWRPQLAGQPERIRDALLQGSHI